MKIGDLVRYSKQVRTQYYNRDFGIVIEICNKSETCTVHWFEHSLFGEHESYEQIQYLEVWIKNT